jgi:argininosuccinate lyase
VGLTWVESLEEEKKMENQSVKLWGCGGRFCDGMNIDLEKLNKSLTVDKRLYAQDIRGSLSYACCLVDVGILRPDELETIRSGFQIISREWENDEIQLKDDDEDVHSVNERRLIEIIGEVGRKIHTGRSRNDQVALDMKMWMKDAVKEVLSCAGNLMEIIIKKSIEKIDVLMPGYTHLQRAQAVRFSHWLLAHGFSLQSDCERLKQLQESVDVMPLGSGAIAGNPFNVDREKLAKLLGFKKTTQNSMFAVSDRDFVGSILN